MHSRLTHIVNVYRIETPVLIARISPNLENSRIDVRHNGIAAISVVIAELNIDTPM